MQLSDCAGQVRTLLVGHKGKVNCVKWLECPIIEHTGQLGHTELVSGSQDSTLIVWRGVDGQVINGFTNFPGSFIF